MTEELLSLIVLYCIYCFVYRQLLS